MYIDVYKRQTTECVIVEKKEDKPEMPMGAPGMGGMGGMM